MGSLNVVVVIVVVVGHLPSSVQDLSGAEQQPQIARKFPVDSILWFARRLLRLERGDGRRLPTKANSSLLSTYTTDPRTEPELVARRWFSRSKTGGLLVDTYFRRPPFVSPGGTIQCEPLQVAQAFDSIPSTVSEYVSNPNDKRFFFVLRFASVHGRLFQLFFVHIYIKYKVQKRGACVCGDA